MDDLRKIADAHYEALPRKAKAKANDFFKDLDVHDRGHVTLHNFLAFMSTAGHTTLSKPSFFRDLDRDRDGKLDFKDVLTLYYIIVSKRPICGHCRNLILGIYFSCINCSFDSSRGIFTLCISCYRSKQSDHSHNGLRATFLDTYALLEKKRSDAVEHRRRRENRSEKFPTRVHSKELVVAQPSVQSGYYAASPSGQSGSIRTQQSGSIRTQQGQTSNGGHHTHQAKSSSNAIVPHGHGQEERWNRALRTLANAATIAGCVASFCLIL